MFAINRTRTDVEQKLKKLLSEHGPFEVTAEAETTLGVTPVVLIAQTTELASLHNDLVDLLEANGGIFNMPEFTKSGFLPHCAIQKTERIQQGDKLRLDSASLVDMFPDGDWQQRKVLDSFKLQSRR